jgi:predicted lipoprotein with Yx(FWY)xxD motif
MGGTRMRVGVAAIAVGLVLAGCAKSNSGGSGSNGTPSTGTAGTLVSVHKGSLGQMLVDSQGNTLYLRTSDTGGTSTCYGSCASQWPALTTSGAPTAGSGVMGSALGTIQRTDGSSQVTIDGHPLYTFAGDTASGDINGEGIGGVWFAASSQGTHLKPSSGNGGGNGGNGGGGGGGYGY